MNNKQSFPTGRAVTSSPARSYPPGQQQASRPPSSPPPLRRWRGRKLVLCSLFGLFLLLGGGTLFWLKSLSPPITLYRIGPQRPINLFIGGGGIIFPHQQLSVSYPATERVVDVKVNPGQHVTANQPLLRLDPTQLNATTKQAADDLEASQNYLNSVSGMGNAVTIAQAHQDYQLAKNRYDSLVARSSNALLRSDGSLLSPIDGVVTLVNVNPGEISDGNTPLVTIMDLSSVVVHVKVPLVYLGQVQVQQTAQVTPSASSHQSFDGKVISIIPQADPQTDTFEVWISIDNQDNKILPGMSAFARIQSPLSALAVPRLAVLTPEGDAAVFVVRQQVARLQHVQVVGRTDDTIYITGNIAAGDQVVLVGLDMLQDGQRVRVTHIERGS